MDPSLLRNKTTGVMDTLKHGAAHAVSAVVDSVSTGMGVSGTGTAMAAAHAGVTTSMEQERVVDGLPA